MDDTTVNALFGYFEALHKLNQNLLTFCGTNAFDHANEQERLIDNMMITIPRLIPYKFTRNTDEIVIIKTDGLMRFLADIPFLNVDYENILQKHTDFLVKAKKIRNKLEHEIDNAVVVGAESDEFFTSSIVYKLNGVGIKVYTEEIISFIKDVNVLFSKIQVLVKQFSRQHQCDCHQYCRRLTRYDYCDFNKIYESNLFFVFGKTMLTF